jgi:hypothetical protein
LDIFANKEIDEIILEKDEKINEIYDSNGDNLQYRLDSDHIMTTNNMYKIVVPKPLNDLEFSLLEHIKLPSIFHSALIESLLLRIYTSLDFSVSITNKIKKNEEEKLLLIKPVEDKSLPTIPDLKIYQVVTCPPFREFQKENWSSTTLSIPKYIPPPPEPPVEIPQKKGGVGNISILKAPQISKPKLKKDSSKIIDKLSLQPENVEEMTDIKPALDENVGNKSPVLKWNQALYLYPPPKNSNTNSYSKFSIITVPNGISPIAENAASKKPVKKRKNLYNQTLKSTSEFEIERYSEIIPFDYVIENTPPSTRWIIPARSEMLLAVAFFSNNSDLYEITLHFETLETKHYYTVKCSGFCGLPSIIREPTLIFESDNKSTPPPDVVAIHKQFVYDRKYPQFEFGPLVVIPGEKLFGPNYLSQNTSNSLSIVEGAYVKYSHKLKFYNNSKFPTKLDFSFKNFISLISTSPADQSSGKTPQKDVRSQKIQFEQTLEIQSQKLLLNPILLSDISTNSNVLNLTNLINNALAAQTKLVGKPGGNIVVSIKDQKPLQQKGNLSKDPKSNISAKLQTSENEPDFLASRTSCLSKLPSFFLSSQTLIINPDNTSEIDLFSIPPAIGFIQDSLVCTVENNPYPLVFPVTSIGDVPSLQVNVSELDFDKILIGKYVEKV